LTNGGFRIVSDTLVKFVLFFVYFVFILAILFSFLGYHVLVNKAVYKASSGPVRMKFTTADVDAV